VYESEPYQESRVVGDDEDLISALRSLPAAKPRPGFVERALANATRRHRSAAGTSSSTLLRPETWIAALTGAAVAAVVTWFTLQPLLPGTPRNGSIALALNESRNIDVLIDSERELQGATIRIMLSGGVVLDGFENERHIDWQADLERGPNLLSLPVLARDAGSGRLVAVIEHGGRTRLVTINLTVNDAQTS
jgi:hypothetical protein